MREFMEGLARECGEIAMSYMDRAKKTSLKGKKDIVTEADLRIEEHVKEAIRKNYPDHGIVSEESEGNVKEKTWYLDPIDGTVNFAHNVPVFCISLAYAEGSELRHGVVYVPYTDEMFYAGKGEGAYLNGRRISASQAKRLESGLAYISSSPRSGNDTLLIDIFRVFSDNAMTVRAIGSCAIELCYIAAGRGECLVKPGQHVWDYAAGMLILMEAGGRITDFEDRAVGLDISDIAASNSHMHNEVLSAIQMAKR